ncbi:methyltransferase domain-containing protein [Tepidiforma thermophila]|uniref:Trans-aconitate 2-methyltransferase n=1 Tax=Tepidiforma thermophila (strain KCTC 52669 / CGMCC 1.13589 / G233) TaxID=2761530 RepID=A0A2A9HFI0_TEPT2|nr:methyltransferase domain-containing protein [Tepidiforma thermophila]PFG73902.1 trans-aconitate 2-methyltransferase [Tepidiforma thermophila]
MPGDWNPDQYERFRNERSQPFFDLLELVRPAPGGRAVDLGCGTGELTRVLHERLGAAETLGIDSSPAMLERAAQFAGGGLRFELADIATFTAERPFDVVFSNAALQWLPDHERLIPRVARLVAPGGQLAFQVPANADHPSHTIAHAVAREEPFATALGGYVRDLPVLPPERYAELLDGLGFADVHVRLQVYVHRLVSSDEVVEWVRGTLLTDYERRLGPELYAQYLARYRERLLAEIGERAPYVYTFKRVLAAGRRPG